MGRRRHPAILPDPGTVYAVPLNDHLFGACRVLRHTTRREADEFGKSSCLVACSRWVGEELPRIDTVALTQVLTLTHHNWNGQLAMLWVSRRPPDDFIKLGCLQLASDPHTVCDATGTWRGFRIQPLREMVES